MLSLPILSINIDPWPLDGRCVHLDIGIEDLANLVVNENIKAPAILSPLRGNLILSLVGRRLRVKGSFSVTVKMSCDRCLEENELLLVADDIDEVLEIIKPGELIAEDQDEDLCLKVIDGRVDLSPLLSELFWLAWPYRHICKENCAGLCFQCGKNLNQGLCGCLKDDIAIN